MYKRMVLVSLLLTLVVVTAAVAQAPSVIKIGVVASRTGPVSPLGESALKAIQLAKEDLKNTVHRYELVIEDAGDASGNPDQAKRAIEKLINVDKVDALIVGLSINGKVIRPYATAAKIPLLCLCSIGDVGDGQYNFTIMPLAEDEAARWTAEAKRRGIKRIALLTQDYPSVNNHVRMLKAEGAQVGIAPVHEDRFEPSTADFRSRIAAAKATSPDVYFVEAFGPSLDILGQQLKDAGVGNIATIVTFSLSGRRELFEGGWYTDSYISPQFKARLDQQYPGSRFVTHMMPYAYDSFNILAQGFESRQGVVQYVRQLSEYAGLAGKLTKLAGSGNFRSAPAVWVIQDGKPAFLRR